jgi:hypothetical protein
MSAKRTDSPCDTKEMSSTPVETETRTIPFAVLRTSACARLSPIPDSSGSKYDSAAQNQLGGRTVGEQRAYSSWRNARQRCNNPSNRDYAEYGGRGIEFDPEWDRFEDFLGDMGEPPAGFTLDRIDPDGDYTPRNCRWAPPRLQARNRRSNRAVEWLGEIRSVAAWRSSRRSPRRRSRRG